MTFEELNEVRNIKTKLTRAEKMLDIWRRAATLKVPANDGLPKSKIVSSQVERVALKIVDAEKRIETLREKILSASSTLEEKIFREFQDEINQTLLILRYVECMFFRDIAEIMRYSEKHVYRIHDRIIRSLKKS